MLSARIPTHGRDTSSPSRSTSCRARSFRSTSSRRATSEGKTRTATASSRKPIPLPKPSHHSPTEPVSAGSSHHKHDMQDTSTAAYDSIRDQLNKKQRVIRRLLLQNPVGLTNEQIARQLGIPINRVTGRICE